MLALDLIDNKTIDVLDHGYVRLVDVMPGDLAEGETCDYAIIDAARVSYQAGTVRKNTDRGLINYLLRNKHTSPFEQVSFKFEIKMPIFVARQWIRHRTASLNEESARYSVLKDEFYLPAQEELRPQSTKNKQATEVSDSFDPQIEKYGVNASDFISDFSASSYEAYTLLLDAGVAREQARMVLPVNIYTSMVWKMDLHNLLHFLQLRLDPHAQLEIRVYAEAIAEFVNQLCPWTWEAFQKYVINSETFNETEVSNMKPLELLPHISLADMTAGELSELQAKIDRLS